MEAVGSALAKLEVSQLGWALFVVILTTVVGALVRGTLVTGRQLERELADRDREISALRADNDAWRTIAFDRGEEASGYARQNRALSEEVARTVVSVMQALPNPQEGS